MATLARTGWASVNASLYRAAHAWRRTGAGRLGAAIARLAAAAASEVAPRPILYVANGRLGDSLLAAAFTARYRAWFQRPVIALARPEAGPVLAPHVDRFVAFDPASLRRSPGLRSDLAAHLARQFEWIVGDLHLHHGAEDLAALVDGLPARRRFAYAGLELPEAVLPHRSLPARAEVVEAPPPDARGSLHHVWHHLLHYHRHLLARLGVRGDLPDAPELPLLPAAMALRATLPEGCWVGCQPTSAQRKKDWPWPRWLDLFAALPTRRFVLLGKAAGGAGPLPPNAVDLRGRTPLREALAIAARAPAFVGVDSGLTHAAAIARRPTVCVAAAAWPGSFFPYPAALSGQHVEVVRDPGHAACAGCRGLCSRAPLWRTHRRGWPCLQSVPVPAVAAALERALARAAAVSPLPETAVAGRS